MCCYSDSGEWIWKFRHDRTETKYRNPIAVTGGFDRRGGQPSDLVEEFRFLCLELLVSQDIVVV